MSHVGSGAAVGAGFKYAPPADEVEWQLRGLCRQEGYDPDLWTPEGRDHRHQAQRAIAICDQCPVEDLCAKWALDHREGFGVWGGMSEDQRRAILAGRKPRNRRKAS